MIRVLKIAAVSLLLSLTAPLLAAESTNNETVGEKVSEGASDMGKGFKKGARKVQNETCEWINGKMECAAKKVGNKARDVKDEAKDAVDAK